MAHTKFEYRQAESKPFLTAVSWIIGASYAFSAMSAVFMLWNHLWLYGILLAGLAVALFFIQHLVNTYIEYSNIAEYKYIEAKENITKLWESGQLSQSEYEGQMAQINRAIKEDIKAQKLKA